MNHKPWIWAALINQRNIKRGSTFYRKFIHWSISFTALTFWLWCSPQPGTGGPWWGGRGQCTRSRRRWRRWWRGWPIAAHYWVTWLDAVLWLVTWPRSTPRPSPRPAARPWGAPTAPPRSPGSRCAEHSKLLQSSTIQCKTHRLQVEGQTVRFFTLCTLLAESYPRCSAPFSMMEDTKCEGDR